MLQLSSLQCCSSPVSSDSTVSVQDFSASSAAVSRKTPAALVYLPVVQLTQSTSSPVLQQSVVGPPASLKLC